jgi:molecular chaperone DnaJ
MRSFVPMALKDYYHLLNLSPGADLHGIKRAFRKLAMQYHPDKHGDSPAYNVHFREIQEAYAVLSDPGKREAYLYQRWLEQSMGHELDKALSQEEILRLFLKAEQHISATDWHSTANDALLPHLLQLFSDVRLATLGRSNNSEAVNSALAAAMRCCGRLSAKGMKTFMANFSTLLVTHPAHEKAWQLLVAKAAHREKLAALKVPVVLLITLLICLSLFLITRR